MNNLNEWQTLRTAKSGLIFLLLFWMITSLTPGECQEIVTMKQQFEQKISQLVGVPVSIEDYRTEYATIHLRNVQIGQKNHPKMPYAKIEKLSATCDFMSLLGGNLVLKDVSISSMVCELTRDKLGNFSKAKASTGEKADEQKTFTDLPFLNLLASNLQLKIHDLKSKKILIVKIDSAKLARAKDSESFSADLKGMFRANATSAAKTPEFSSNFSCKMKLSGQLSQPKVQGTATIKALIIHKQVLKQQVKLDKASFKFNEKSITTDDLTGSWGRSKIKISGQISDFRKFNLSLKYALNPIAFDELSKAFISTKGLTLHGTGTSEGTIQGPADNFSVAGKLAIPSCRVEAPVGNAGSDKFIFSFQNLTANYNYAGRKIAINRANAKIFAGRINGSGKIYTDANPIKFDVNLTGTGLRAERFLSENSTQKNAVSGPVNATFVATGDARGLTSWNGKGDFRMKNGRYNAPPVLTPMLSLVNLKEFSSGDIKSGHGTFKLNQGIMTTSDLVFVSSAGKVYYRGQVGLDTTLSGKMNLIFAEDAVAKSQALQQISMDKKSANIPTRVAGTLLSPSFPGFSAGKLLELGLKRKGQKMLNDILFPQKNEPTSQEVTADQKSQDPGKQILNDLQNIFKPKRKPAPEPTKEPVEEQKQEPEKDSDRLKKELRKIFRF